ncbi:glycosyltransferase [Modestobacter italicus]|uniref:glycosyltransferase n=1 Tax=Modestobacter italicus (strain DSM 44449 / CECT 9708 / BC 501) TaxID=2732864 RepID=UPI001C9814FB|nr:glycosyltransferase [Modestobacter italicus]
MTGTDGGRPGRVVYGITVPQSAATLLRGQLGWFREQGWDVHLVTSPGAQLGTVAERERVTVHPLPMERDTSPLRDLVALVRWVLLLLRLRPDVLNVGTPKAGLLGVLAGWLTRVPVRVYVMRGLRLESSRSRLQYAVLWLAERLTVALATEVVCVSHSLRDEAAGRRLFGRRDHPVVLARGSSNGVDPRRWDAGLAGVDREAVRRDWGVAPGELVVGFLGRIARVKGVQDLLAAAERLTDLPVRLVLVGPVEDDDLRPEIAALGDRVVSSGEWTSDPYDVFTGMDVFCLPTRREGFPNVVLEAALAQVPTITTTATGARDSVVPGVTGWLVETGDVPQLADAIRACEADREGVRAAGRAARARALSDFRPQTIWSGLQSLYLGGSAAAPAPALRAA